MVVVVKAVAQERETGWDPVEWDQGRGLDWDSELSPMPSVSAEP